MRNNIDFQTPVNVAEFMVNLIPLGYKTILEPTCGAGNLVSKLKGYDVTAPKEFFKMKPRRFDAVVMNPPFTPMKLGYEILFKCMDMSDLVIALMPWLTIINSQNRTQKLIDFGLFSITHLPRNVFPGTRVQTCIIILRKGHNKDCIFDFFPPPSK